MSHEQEKKLVDLKTRTKGLALPIVRLYSALPQTADSQLKGKQLLRSGTSAQAQTERRWGSRSTAEFINNVEGMSRNSRNRPTGSNCLEKAAQ